MWSTVPNAHGLGHTAQRQPAETRVDDGAHDDELAGFGPDHG
jgi:hypothetical protein